MIRWKPALRHPKLVDGALALCSALLTLGVLEGALRVSRYQFSPVLFMPPDAASDRRAYHLWAVDPHVSPTEPVTVFDTELLWRPNPSASPEFNEQGFRGPSLRETKAPDEYWIVAIGDSNTLGPLLPGEHWPGHLQYLVDMNAGKQRIHIVNAGVYGYSSLQGLRRFRQVLRYRPDLAYFSFGANDAHPAHTTDAEYARKAAWLRNLGWSRLAPPVVHRLWSLFHRDSTAWTHRVPLAEYRTSLEAFVKLAHASGVAPVLLTRPYHGSSSDPGYWLTYAPEYREATLDVGLEQGVECVDVYEAFRGADDLFVDDSHFNRKGYQRMAQLLTRRLKAIGLLETDYLHAAEVNLGTAPDNRPELVSGWWGREPWGAGGPPGRWTAAEAILLLERRGGEEGLAVDLTLFHPDGVTGGRIETNGVPILSFRHPNGRLAHVLDVRSATGREVEVRFVADRPYIPRQRDPSTRDARSLGMFVHSVRLTPSRFADPAR